MAKQKKIIAIVGPTASGKSDLAIDIAMILDGEIICADSRTIYKGMDIGSAKPSSKDQAKVRHHCLDIITPDVRYSVADFKLLAETLINSILAKGKTPIIVGGSGLYIDSILYNYDFNSGQNINLPENLENMTLLELQDLCRRYEYNPPEQVWQNKRHLEAFIKRGGIKSTKSNNSGALIFGINPGKEILYSRISKRVDKMIESGFINEVNQLLNHYQPNAPGFNTPGYKPLIEYLYGKISLKEATDKFKSNDQRLSKKQLTWFKRNPEICWFANADDAKSAILKECS